MTPRISIRRFRERIKQLPEGRRYADERLWYSTQKEHWLGWLKGYHTPSAYGRQVDTSRDAAYAYNHIMCPEMLIYLARQAKIPRNLLRQAVMISNSDLPLAAQVSQIRVLIPWSMIAEKLWPRGLDMRYRALSVNEPWAEKIVTGKKHVENRPRPTKVRERVYVYETKTTDHPGRLIGSVKITGCKKVGDRHYQWQLAEAIQFKRPVPVDPRRHPNQTFWQP